MKKITITSIVAFMAFAINGWGQTTIDFETEGDGYTPSATEGSGYTDVFNRTNPNIGGNSTYMWSVEDITLSDPYITLDQVDITGASSFTFSIDMISHHYNDWDNNDELLITYTIDGGASQNLMWVENTGEQYNNPAALDPDFDGVGDCAFVLPALTTGTGTGGCVVSSDIFETFVTSAIAVSGTTLDITLQFNGLTSTDEGIYLDNIIITPSGSGGVNNPTAFAATTNSTSQIDLTWLQNANTNDVMVAWTSDGTFGVPIDGTAYVAGNSITGGGTVIYNGSDLSYNHIGLSSGTQYFYKAWSVDGTVTYSTGVTDDATTLKEEPTNHAGAFTAGTPAATSIPLTWSDNDGAVPADGFLVKASTSSTFADPVDGFPEADDTDMSDGSGQVNVAHGVETYTWTGLSQGTQYYFKIWPYTNSGAGIDYKTDGTVPTANETTTTANTDLIISEVSDPNDNFRGRFVEIHNLGSTTVDFGTETWYLVRQAGGAGYANIQLTGTLLSGESYTIAYNIGNFSSQYGFDPDADGGAISGNGNDGYFLYYGGDETSGTLIDAYGVIDEDGTGTDWEYTDTKAVRLRSVASPNTTWEASEWDIPGLANVDDMTPSEHKEDVTWLGVDPNDWNTKGANWSSAHGFIPDASFNVTIPSAANNPAIGTQSACNNLTLTSDAVLSVNPGEPITIYGNLSIAAAKSRAAASFIVDSDATGNGSVIVKGTITGSANVKRYFPQYTSAADGWHYIGSPVNDMTILGSDFDPTGTNDDLFAWDEDDYIWRNYLGGNFPGSTFANGMGYMVAFESTVTNTFTGTLNTSDVTFNNLTKTPLPKGDGWHLLGNPFASAIEWDDGISSWSLTNVNGVAKVYDESTGNYSDINPSGIIPSTNGFFIWVSNATNSITIPAASRVHDATNNYKNSRSGEMDETLQLLVNNDANNFSDRTTIRFRDDAEMDFDWAFDSPKMFGQSTAPQLWTLVDGEEYSTNNLPPIYESYVLPLNFKAGVNSTFHIFAEGIESFYLNSEIYLEDIQTGNTIDFREQPIYTFTGQPSDDNARFALHFFGVTDVGDIIDDGDIAIYGYNQSIFVKTESININYTIEVFDIMGRRLLSERFFSTGLDSFGMDVEAGVYIVKLQSATTTHVNKINLR